MENNIVNDLLQAYDKLRKRNYKFIIEDRRDDLHKQASQDRNKPVKTIRQNHGTAQDQAHPGDLVRFDNSDNVSNANDSQTYFIGPEGEQIPMDNIGDDAEDGKTNGPEVENTQTENIFVKFTQATKKWDGELGDETTDHALLYRLSALQGGAEATLDLSSAIVFATNYFSKYFPVEWDTLKHNKHLDFFGKILADLAQSYFFVGLPLSVDYTEEEINSIAHNLAKYREFIFTDSVLDDSFSKYASEFLFLPLDGGRSRIYFQGKDKKDFIEIKSDFISRLPKNKEIIPASINTSGDDNLFFTPKGEDFHEDLDKLFRSFKANASLFTKKEISNDTFINNINKSKEYVENLAAIYASIKTIGTGDKGYQILGSYESQVREWCDRLFESLTPLEDNEYINTKESYKLSTIHENLWRILHNISLACAQGIKYIEDTTNNKPIDLDYYFSINGVPYCRLDSIPVTNSKLKTVDNLLVIKDDKTVLDLGRKLLEKFSSLTPEKDYNVLKILNKKQLIGYIKRCILLSTGSEYREPYLIDIVKEYIKNSLKLEGSINNLVIYSDIHPYYQNPVKILDRNSLYRYLLDNKYEIKSTSVGCNLYVKGKKIIVFEVTSDAYIDMHILPSVIQQFSVSTERNPYLLPGFI